MKSSNLQSLKHNRFLTSCLNKILHRGEILCFLENVFHEDIEEFTARLLLLKFVRWTVANRWVTENWPGAQLNVFV